MFVEALINQANYFSEAAIRGGLYVPIAMRTFFLKTAAATSNILATAGISSNNSFVSCGEKTTITSEQVDCVAEKLFETASPTVLLVSMIGITTLVLVGPRKIYSSLCQLCSRPQRELPPPALPFPQEIAEALGLQARDHAD